MTIEDYRQDEHRARIDRDIDLRRLGLLMLAAVEMSHDGYVRIARKRNGFGFTATVRMPMPSGRTVPYIQHETEGFTLLTAADAAVNWLRSRSGDAPRET